MESQADFSTQTSHPEVDGAAEVEGGDGILEPSSAPYSNRWFTEPKKNGTLRFIQDLQSVNKVTIRNAGIGQTIDEFTEAFAGRSIYSVGDLY